MNSTLRPATPTAAAILETPTGWSTNLPQALASAGEEAILRPAGLTLSTYSTERWLRTNPKWPRQFLWTSACRSGGHPIALERLSPWAAALFEDDLGLVLATDGESSSGRASAAVEEALQLLTNCPWLRSSVTALVCSVHILSVPDPARDCSFSDPTIPFSVFVSVPDVPQPERSLRVAEALAHEALHLQLSLVEHWVPLVEDRPREDLVLSPWKGEGRTVRGLLHAVYVFSILSCFWAEVARLGTDRHQQFAHSRVAAIDAEVRRAGHLADAPSLTASGARLAANLLSQRGRDH